MLDFVNEENFTRVETIHTSVKSLKVCPNGRYVLTAGEQGDITIWKVKKTQLKV